MDTNSYGGQYASDAASPPTRESVGSGRYLSDQQDSISRLHDAIQKLGNVLEPALMPEPPAAAPGEGKSPQIMRAMPLTSVTAGRIRENTEAIDVAVSRILRLIDRAQETV